MALITAPPRSVYLHVPFCRHRCGYCNFTVVAGRDDLIDSYLAAIEREMSWQVEPREVDTIFLGGGTPTHLEPSQLERLLQAVHRWFPPAAGHEFSVEANPRDVSDDKLEVLEKYGVTRISLGAQSFHSATLRQLERDHDAEQIVRAVQSAKRHLPQVSLDLIFGAPTQSLDIWRADLQQARQLEPDHVSTYGLTFEKGTSFWSRREHGQLQPLKEELEGQMYELAIDELTAVGFEHYEVSNFARPGKRCRHNEVYWTGDEFYAVGPGAARYVDGRREVNHRSTTTYLRRVQAGESPVAESEILDAEQRARERLVFGLRRLEGVALREFAKDTGYDVQALVAQPLERFLQLGLLELTPTHLRLTRRGLLISDSLWPHFLA